MCFFFSCFTPLPSPTLTCSVSPTETHINITVHTLDVVPSIKQSDRVTEQHRTRASHSLLPSPTPSNEGVQCVVKDSAPFPFVII